VRRELEEAAKVLGERIRTSDATSEDCFELGAILLRKKLYTQATKNLERAVKLWDGAPEELAQARAPRPSPLAPSCAKIPEARPWALGQRGGGAGAGAAFPHPSPPLSRPRVKNMERVLPPPFLCGPPASACHLG